MVEDVQLPEFVRDAVKLGFPLEVVTHAWSSKDPVIWSSSRFMAVSAVRAWANVHQERIREQPYSDVNFARFKELKFVVSRADLALEDLCPE